MSLESISDKEFFNLLIKKIQNVGKAQAILGEVISDDLFDKLSKHDPFWESEDEAKNDRLYNTRSTLSWIQEKLFEVNELLEGDEE